MVKVGDMLLIEFVGNWHKELQNKKHECKVMQLSDGGCFEITLSDGFITAHVLPDMKVHNFGLLYEPVLAILTYPESEGEFL